MKNTTYNLTEVVNIEAKEEVNVTRVVDTCTCNSTRISGLTFTSRLNSDQCGLVSSNSSNY